MRFIEVRSLRVHAIAIAIVWALTISLVGASSYADSVSESLGVPSSAALLGLIGGVLLLSACFAAVQTALLKVSPQDLTLLASLPGLSGRLAQRIANSPSHLSTTVLAVRTFANLFLAILMPLTLFSILAGPNSEPLLIDYILGIILTVLTLVFFGDLLPGAIGSRAPRRTIRVGAGPLFLVDAILRPVTWLLVRLTESFFRLTRLDKVQAAPSLTDDELKSAVSDSEEHGVLEEEEGQMIQGILEFNDALLREILVPRPDVVALSEDATVTEALDLFRKHDFSRMPVYRENLDHIAGVLFAKDLLPAVANRELEKCIQELVRPARFVPETMTIHAFLKDAQRMHTHQAIVVDEYGGTEGLVTLEDAIEEVVGAIHDDDEEKKPRFEVLGNGKFRVDGSIPLDELSELIGISIEDEKHETIGGFFMDLTNKIPERGDQSEYQGALFTVESVDGKRVSSLRVDLAKAQAGGSSV